MPSQSWLTTSQLTMGACPSADVTVKPLAARPVLLSYKNAAPMVSKTPKIIPNKICMVGVSIVQPAKLAHPVMVPSNPTSKGEHSVQCALLALNVPEALSSTVIGALIRPLEFDMFAQKRNLSVCDTKACISTKCTSPAYRIAFLKMHSGTFRRHFRFLITSTLLDRGWSMTLSSTVFFLLFAIVLTRADNQQIQQLCVNAALCLLAVRSGLSPGRKSDLQMHRTPSALGDYRVLFVSATSRTVS